MDANTRRLVWDTRLLLRRAARDRRRRLVREIAEYRTPAEREELLDAVERCPYAGREEVRRLALAAVRADIDHTPFHLHG